MAQTYLDWRRCASPTLPFASGSRGRQRARRDAGPVGEPVNAAGRSPPGSVPVNEAPHVVPAGNPVAPSASHVATRATSNSGRAARPLRTSRTQNRSSGHGPSQASGQRPIWPAGHPGVAVLGRCSLSRSRPPGRRLRRARSRRPCSTPTAPASGSPAPAPTRRASSSRPRWRRPPPRRATTARRCPEHLVSRGPPLRRPARDRLPEPARQHAEHLPGSGEEVGPRRGVFLGDGTGVGKGHARPSDGLGVSAR